MHRWDVSAEENWIHRYGIEMVAKEVNGQTIHAVIDNQTYNNSKSKFYMDKNRNIMVPVSMLRDALNCSAHVYDKERPSRWKDRVSPYRWMWVRKRRI